jgi:hypothetical protein
LARRETHQALDAIAEMHTVLTASSHTGTIHGKLKKYPLSGEDLIDLHLHFII